MRVDSLPQCLQLVTEGLIERRERDEAGVALVASEAETHAVPKLHNIWKATGSHHMLTHF